MVSMPLGPPEVAETDGPPQPNYRPGRVSMPLGPPEVAETRRSSASAGRRPAEVSMPLGPPEVAETEEAAKIASFLLESQCP